MRLNFILGTQKLIRIIKSITPVLS